MPSMTGACCAALLDYARAGEPVVVVALDRLGRSPSVLTWALTEATTGRASSSGPVAYLMSWSYCWAISSQRNRPAPQ